MVQLTTHFPDLRLEVCPPSVIHLMKLERHQTDRTSFCNNGWLGAMAAKAQGGGRLRLVHLMVTSTRQAAACQPCPWQRGGAGVPGRVAVLCSQRRSTVACSYPPLPYLPNYFLFCVKNQKSTKTRNVQHEIYYNIPFRLKFRF